MKLKLKIWRQENLTSQGELVDYELEDVNSHMSFLEMLDVLNEQIISDGELQSNSIMIVAKEFAVNADW